MGQRKKCTDARIKLFMEGISKKNLTTLLACKYAGICKTSWYKWLADEREKGEESEYYGLQALYDKAFADRAVRWLEKIEVASFDPRYWKAAAWLLAKCYADEYGDKEVNAPTQQINIQLDENDIKDRIKNAIKNIKSTAKDKAVKTVKAKKK